MNQAGSGSPGTHGQRRGAPRLLRTWLLLFWGRLFSSPPVLHPPLIRSGPLPSLRFHPSPPPPTHPRGGSPSLVFRRRESPPTFPERGSGTTHRTQRCSGPRRPPRLGALGWQRAESDAPKDAERSVNRWWHLIWRIADLFFFSYSFSLRSFKRQESLFNPSLPSFCTPLSRWRFKIE